MKNILFFFNILIVFSSCTKDTTSENAQSFYYGQATITIANLPGTPPPGEVFFNGVRLGRLNILGNPGSFQIEANKPGKLAVYENGTKNLIADTLITVGKNMISSLLLANSTELGIKGWVHPKKVSKDSISFQLINQMTDAYPYPVLDAHLYLVDPGTFEEKETGIVIRHLEYGKLYPEVINLPLLKNSENIILAYVLKLKVPGSSEFIRNRGSGTDFVLLFNYSGEGGGEGTYGIYVMKDNLQGEIVLNKIYL